MSGIPSLPDLQPLRDGVALAHLPGVGCVAFRELVERWGSASEAFRVHARLPDASAALAWAAEIVSGARGVGARLLVFGEPDYPERLCDLTDPPPYLLALGEPDSLAGPAVSIVGTRQSSSTGERMAHRLAGALAEAGATIVSGMARGIDAAAHRGALDVGGRTVAVLASGIDVPYPASHRALHAEIAARGAILSEAAPGSHPLPGAFPRRNRIIAALAQTVIVVEAGSRSGALITSRLALELGREIGAVPGSVDSPRSAGSNTLLRDGAVVITSVDDALQLAGFAPTGSEGAAGPMPARADRAPRAPVRKRIPASTSHIRAPIAGGSDSLHVDLLPGEAVVVGAMRAGATDLDAVAQATRLSTREVAAAVTGLEVAGLVWTDHRGGLRLAR